MSYYHHTIFRRRLIDRDAENSSVPNSHCSLVAQVSMPDAQPTTGPCPNAMEGPVVERSPTNRASR